MYGLDVMEVMTMSGHPSIIDKIKSITTYAPHVLWVYHFSQCDPIPILNDQIGFEPGPHEKISGAFWSMVSAEQNIYVKEN